MNRFGLIGRNISYSFSQTYFEEKFRNEGLKDCSYQIFDLNEIQEVEKLFESADIKGLNVTIPYKQEIIRYLDKLSPEAKKIGAVNCVQISNGIKTGYNTDVYGFEISLKNFIPNQEIEALLLGDGGAARAVRYVLDKLGIKNKTVSRKGNFSYAELNRSEIEKHSLIINCAPLGTFPAVEQYPEIPYDFLCPNHYLFDLIYNPAKTRFLEFGEKKGAKIKNGYEMLKLQAEKSWEIWQQFL